MATCKRISLTVACLIVGTFSAASCSSSKGPATSEPVTFASKIQPLVQEKCQTCHHEGGIAPFSLVTYDDVKRVGVAAKAKISTREMPPWGPAPDATCEVKRGFKNDLSLSDEQIALFGQWVDLGMPSGDISRLPQPMHQAASPIGLVDKTDSVDTGADYVVPGGAADDIRCFPVDPGFTEDAWISESIVVPGDSKVVHHALVYVDTEHEGMKHVGDDGSYRCFGGPELSANSLILAWSPGGAATVYGDGAGLKIPQGAHLVMQVHYHPIATKTTGQMRLEMKRLVAKPSRVANFYLVGNAASATDAVQLLPGPDDPPGGPAFLIPANAKGHTETMEFTIPTTETRLSSIGAHMHWAGVAMKVEVERKQPSAQDPDAECLLSTKYDFNWQRTYTYDAPLELDPLLRAGDRLRITCTYDNTMDNPRIAKAMRELRRNAPMDIKLGGKSTDEMCQAILVFVE